MTPDQARAKWAEMTPEERLAMAKAAPKVAGPWVTDGDDEWERETREGNIAAAASRFGETWYFFVSDGTSEQESDASGLSREEMLKLIDARLLAEGWVLE